VIAKQTGFHEGNLLDDKEIALKLTLKLIDKGLLPDTDDAALAAAKAFKVILDQIGSADEGLDPVDLQQFRNAPNNPGAQGREKP